MKIINTLEFGSENRLDHITRSCFEEAAAEAGIRAKTGMERFDHLREELPGALALAAEQLTEEGITHAEQLSRQILASGHISL